MTPFLVLTLPRSRSFWLSKFLDCPHDPSRRFATNADVADYFNNGACGVDTALGLIWRGFDLLVRRDLRVAVVHRPVADVLASLSRLGIRHDCLPAAMARYAERLLAIPGSHFTYSQIETFDGAARLFHACRGEVCDAAHWAQINARRAECDHAAYAHDMTNHPWSLFAGALV